jgi:HAMP domain-containing protein
MGILISGLLQYRAEEKWLRQSLGSLLFNIARTGVLLVDGDLHSQVVEEGQTDTAAYKTLRTALLQIQEKNELADPVYTIVDFQGDQARFAVISQGETRVGEPYQLAPEIRPVLRRVFEEGAAAYTNIYKNEHGTWITAFAPVQSSDGRTVAALDVDFRADVYLSELANVRRRLYLHFIVGAFIALVVGGLLARQVTRPVGQLAALARKVVEGDLTGRVRIDSQDEIGMLGNVLHLMVERLQVSHRSVVDVLVRALEARDGRGGSLRRLSLASTAMADRLELSPTHREALELGALLHDIGDIRIPEAILEKPGPLTPEERLVIQQHPSHGVELIETVPLLTPALDVVGNHHERYDGGGYPQGLRAEEIPLTARIFSVVDTLEAMTHDRPHRTARPLAEAFDEVKQGSGKQFDPKVVEVALSIPEPQWKDLLEC